MEYRNNKFTYEGEVVAEITQGFFGDRRTVKILGDIEYHCTLSECCYRVRGSTYEDENNGKNMDALIKITNNCRYTAVGDELTNRVLKLRELLCYKYECVNNHVYDEYYMYSGSRYWPVKIEGNVAWMDGYCYNLSDKFLQNAGLDGFKNVAGSLLREQGCMIMAAMPSTTKSARN
jgi:hypothetical protein